MTCATWPAVHGPTGSLQENAQTLTINDYEEGNSMKFKSGIAAAIALSFAVAGLAACDKDGPMERAGEKVDNAGKKVGESIENAGEKLQDAAKDAKK